MKRLHFDTSARNSAASNKRDVHVRDAFKRRRRRAKTIYVVSTTLYRNEAGFILTLKPMYRNEAGFISRLYRNEVGFISRLSGFISRLHQVDILKL